jgi:hypothetical protein
LVAFDVVIKTPEVSQCPLVVNYGELHPASFHSLILTFIPIFKIYLGALRDTHNVLLPLLVQTTTMDQRIVGA